MPTSARCGRRWLLTFSLSGCVLGGLIEGQQFKTSTSVIEGDVVVRSKELAHVVGLRDSDFTVFEDGVRQEIRSFVEVGSVATDGLPDSQRGQVTSTDGRRAPSSHEPPLGFAALIFEQLSPQARVLAGDAARAFVSEALASNIFVGVYTMDRAPHVLAQFTSERRTLDKAIEKRRRFAGYALEYAGDVPGAEFGSPTTPGWDPTRLSDDRVRSPVQSRPCDARRPCRGSQRPPATLGTENRLAFLGGTRFGRGSIWEPRQQPG